MSPEIDFWKKQTQTNNKYIKRYKNSLVYALSENLRMEKRVYFVPVADGRREGGQKAG